MRDINDLLELIKEVAVNAVKAGEPVSIDHGTVKSVDPLVIDMGLFTIEDDLILITGTIRNLIEAGALNEGDAVLCLKDAGGDDWTIMDTVEVDDGE